MERYPEKLSVMELPGLLRETGKLMNLKYVRRLFPYLVAFYIPVATLVCLDTFHQHDVLVKQLHLISSTLAGQLPPSGMVPPPSAPPVSRTEIVIKSVEFLVGFIFSLGLAASTTLTVAGVYQWEETEFTYKRVAALVPGAMWRLFLTSLWVSLISIGISFFSFVALMIPYLLGTTFIDPVVALYMFSLGELLVTVVLVYYFAIVFTVVDKVAILDHVYGPAGIKRTKNLLKEKKMTVLCVVIFNLVLAYILYMILNTLVLGPRWTKPIALAFGVVLVTLSMAFEATLRTVLYFSCKSYHQQREGNWLDLPSYAKVEAHLDGGPAKYALLGNGNT